MSDGTQKTISIRIAIDIPVDIAAETLSKIQPMLAQITGKPESDNRVHELGIVDDEAEQLKEAGRQEFIKRRAEFAQKEVQAYRIYRRIRSNFEKLSQAHTAIATQLDWPSSVIQSVISNRRNKINLYLRNRNKKTVLRLAYEGWTNKAIANRLKVHTKTVSRLLKEARASLKGGSDV